MDLHSEQTSDQEMKTQFEQIKEEGDSQLELTSGILPQVFLKWSEAS